MLTSHVFQKLEDYSRARHSNVVTIFRDVDKVRCPTTDAPQLLSVRPSQPFMTVFISPGPEWVAYGR